MEPNNIITDEQVNDIAQQLDDEIKGTDLEKIAQFPSNQGKEETDSEDRETGESKSMMVKIDPNTGEHKIIGQADNLDDDETFEEMCERIKNSDLKLDFAPITEKELVSYIASNKDSSMINEIANDVDLSADTIKGLLEIVNRKINREEFNVYKAFPDEIKSMVDKYLVSMQVPACSTQGKQFRNMISEQLISEFVTNINIDRTMHDFNKELEDLFTKGSSELADSIIGYTEERNKKYREYAEQMQDEEKKEKVNQILDQIDEAYNLTNLKQFASRCKIKKFDLEKPNKVYKYFLQKYAESSYNIYDINMARPILYRNINPEDKEEYTSNDIDAFFICFCKQCMNMKPEIVTEHAYMYYVIYNIVLMDMNKGDQKHVSEAFIDNIKEVIHNIKQKNNFI